MLKSCPGCFNLNPITERFCTGCGVWLAPPVEPLFPELLPPKLCPPEPPKLCPPVYRAFAAQWEDEP